VCICQIFESFSAACLLGITRLWLSFQQKTGCVVWGWLLFSGSRKGARRWRRGKKLVLGSSDALILAAIT
jgi:hypothetical protein